MKTLMQVAAVSVAMIVAVGATGCATPPIASYRSAALEVPGPLPAPPVTQVVFYPNAGQSPAQQDRDRYECYRWAVQQTGFDPAQPQVAPHQRVAVMPATPAGAGATTGILAGAVLGAAVSNPRNGGAGALLGAVTGGLLGASADAANEQQAQRLQQHYDQDAAHDAAQSELQASTFRRAISACLGGRGYTVE